MAISAASLPVYSSKTARLMQNDYEVCIPQAAGLKGRVERIETIRAKLDVLDRQPKASKLLALLQMAVVLAMEGGTVVAIIFAFRSSPAAGAITTGVGVLTGFIAPYGMTTYFNYSWRDVEENRGVLPSCGLLEPLVYPIAGAFVPPVKAFGTHRSRAKLQAMEEDVRQDIGGIKQYIQNNQTNIDAAHSAVKRQIEALKTAQMTMENAEHPLEATKKITSQPIEALETAQRELEAVLNYFNEEIEPS
jgi:hypothetical protein